MKNMNIGFIDYYLDEWHANNYPKMLSEISGGRMKVNLAYAMIDSPIGGRTTDEWCRDMGIRRALSIEEVVNNSDALIVLSPDNCEMHEQLCRIPLMSGKPTYIDKTFAPDGDAAKRIFAVAQEHSTPCYSTSALRYASEYKGIKEVDSISSWGPNGLETYSIHQLEPIVMLMGKDAKRVMYIPGNDYYKVIIDYGCGRTASMNGFIKGSPFMMNITSKEGAKLINVESDYFGGFIKNLAAFFDNPKNIVPHEETIAIMTIRACAIKAQQTPMEWVNIK